MGAREEALGVEPLSGEFTAEWLLDAAKKSRVAVKTWLMDQRRVVGVGNIYASEALFRARIDPRRPANTLKKKEAARLVEATREVLGEAIDFRGTTLLDYRDASGERGGFVGPPAGVRPRGRALPDVRAPPGAHRPGRALHLLLRALPALTRRCARVHA